MTMSTEQPDDDVTPDEPREPREDAPGYDEAEYVLDANGQPIQCDDASSVLAE